MVRLAALSLLLASCGVPLVCARSAHAGRRRPRATRDGLARLGFHAAMRTYPGVGHAVSQDMMKDIRRDIVDYVRAEGCARWGKVTA